MFDYATRRATRRGDFSSPPRAGYIEFVAQCTPHLAWVDSRFDRLGTGEAVETGDDVVDEDGVPPHLAELFDEQFPKFSQAHRSTVPKHAQSSTARHTSTGSSTWLEPAFAAAAALAYPGSDSTCFTASPMDPGLGGRTTTALPCLAARLANSH